MTDNLYKIYSIDEAIDYIKNLWEGKVIPEDYLFGKTTTTMHGICNQIIKITSDRQRPNIIYFMNPNFINDEGKRVWAVTSLNIKTHD